LGIGIGVGAGLTFVAGVIWFYHTFKDMWPG
jgi:hypothetical protein